MPPDETLVNRVRTAIGKSRRVEEKKMFGGIAFMVAGKMCVTVGKDRIMCRIDPAPMTRRSNGSLHHRRHETSGIPGYVHIDADALSTKPDLGHWVKLALEFNGRVKASTRKRLTHSHSRPLSFAYQRIAAVRNGKGGECRCEECIGQRIAAQPAAPLPSLAGRGRSPLSPLRRKGSG